MSSPKIPGFRFLGSERARELGFSVAVLVVTGLFRFRTLEMPEIGGDALKVWEFARQLLHGTPLPHAFNHHTARFGLVLPTLAVQWIFGSGATSYFIGSLLFTCVLHLGVFLLASRLRGPLAGALAVAALLWLPEMVRTSSQILPELYGPTYTVLAFLAAYRFLDARPGRASVAWLAACAVSLFFAYGSKISYLYYAPGCAFVVAWGQARADQGETGSWFARVDRRLGRPNYRAGLLLTLFVLLLLGAETLGYRLWTDHGSQISVMEKTHGLSEEAEIRGAEDLFRIYRTAGYDWQMFLAAGGLGLGLSAIFERRRARLFCLATAVYLILFTFILRQLSPPIPWIRPHPRYLASVAPALAILIGVGIEVTTVRFSVLAARLLPKLAKKLEPLAARFLLGASILVIGFLFLREAPPLLQRGPMSPSWNRTSALSRYYSRAFSAGIPIVSRSQPAKPLHAIGGLYVRPELLVRGGQLPIHRAYSLDTSQSRRKMTIFSRAVPAAKRDETAARQLIETVEARVRKHECVIVVEQNGRHFSKKGYEKPDCPRVEDGTSPVRKEPSL